jgi:hypothetical protein
MKIFFLAILLTTAYLCPAQNDSTWLRGFPITDYMVPLNDSTMVVQLEMPDGLKLADRQLGLVYSVYKNSTDDVVQKGYGRCYLVKGNYHYFAISHNESGRKLEKGDLLYTFLPIKKDIFHGRTQSLAAHFIRLMDVHGNYLFDRYNVFLDWTENDENNLIDSLVADIRFTGSYFLDVNPEMNLPIKSGPYQGGEILEFMAECQPATVKEFLDYMIARPRNYAGHEWKFTEIFATWLKEGSPMIKKD